MADGDIRRSSLDRIKRMPAGGLTKATPADAPEIELEEEFWHNARVREHHSTPQDIGASAHRPGNLRVLPRRRERSSDAQGEGAQVYAQSHGKSCEPIKR